MKLSAFRLEGKLEQLPLPVLIMQLLDERRTGILTLGDEKSRCWIYFDQGFPAGVYAPKLQDFLGAVLRELNLVDDATFNETMMAMAKTKRLQGQILLEMGKITEAQLERALSLQLARKLARLFGVKQGPYQFQEDEEPPAKMEPIRVNPFALIHNGIRNSYTEEELDRALQILTRKACRVSARFLERKDLFEFVPEDLADVELLQEFRLPLAYVQIAQSGPVSAKMFLLTLLWCGMLDLEEEGQAVAFPARSQKAAPPAEPAEPIQQEPKAPGPAGAQPRAVSVRSARGARPPAKVAPELRKKIPEKFAQVTTTDLYQVLEVGRSATAEQIDQAFVKLAKIFHPDRIADCAEPELTHQMDFILARIGEARTTLRDPTTRVRYDQTLAGGAGSKGEARPAEAELQFQKAMVFFKKKDFAQAAEILRWAVELDPGCGDYAAYLAWVSYQLGAGGDSEQEQAQAARTRLLTVAKAHPQCFFAFRFLAAVLRKLGEQEAYEKALRIAYRLDPHDIEVTRELRLIKTRQEKDEHLRFFGIKLKK